MLRVIQPVPCSGKSRGETLMTKTAGCFTLGLLLAVSSGNEGKESRLMLSLPRWGHARHRFSLYTVAVRDVNAMCAVRQSPLVSNPDDPSETVAQVRAMETADMVTRLKEIFRDEGLPGELVWVAEIESAFNPRARSRAGAVGLFQVMPATARRFGLHTGYRGDERTDPAKNAKVAARYLATLYRQFGDWRLALAAYNAGETRVSRLLVEAGGSSYADIERRLPGQTRRYVPRVLNVIEAAEGLGPDELAAPIG